MSKLAKRIIPKISKLYWTDEVFQTEWQQALARQDTEANIALHLGLSPAAACNWKNGKPISRPTFLALKYINAFPEQFPKQLHCGSLGSRVLNNNSDSKSLTS